MRVLAEAIMLGRWLAAVFAFVNLPVLSPATVALVTLRKGAYEGTWILLALLAPSLFWLFAGIWVSFLLVSILGSVLVFAASLLLRAYGSWSWVLLGVAASAALGAAAVDWLIDIRSDVLNMADLMGMSEIEKADFSENVNQLLEKNLVSPMMAFSAATGVIVSLILARWWQAQLYNPGGFREEFHGLRIEPKQVLIGVVLGVGLMQLPAGGGGLLIVGIPLFFGGLGYLHWWMMRGHYPWMIWVLYLGIFMSLWVIIMVITIGLMDSLLNLRARYPEVDK